MISISHTLYEGRNTDCVRSCMLEIVGARFHCAICEDVDICSNCESAGLPGDLESADGGHSSKHIMIKVCSFSLSCGSATILELTVSQ
jgi:hypothetical protein